jgi:predicted methyltransferase
MPRNIRLTRLRRPAIVAALASLLLGVSGCATTGEGASPFASVDRHAIADPLRTDADRAADARRKPLAFLEFTQVRPGMRVLDVSAGDGYTTQLLALTVGTQGTVWAQTPAIRPGFAERLKAHPQANIIPVLQPFNDPVPHDAPPLDLVTLIFNYHDIANLPVDRAQMNQRLFGALKPGGHMVVLDHSARAGRGANDTWTLHRIDEAMVVKELEQAGFHLEASSDAFRNPEDPRTERIFEMKIPVDNFALRFVKPQ